MRLGLAALLLLTLAACGGGAGSDDASSPTPSPTTESAAAPSEVASSAEIASDVPSIANAIRSAVSDVGDVVEITEANDVNDLIGRPGQYDQAAFMASQVIGCDGDYDELSIDCGAKLERWASKADAQARSKDIQQKLKDYGLGAEWNYIQGRVLLRVAGDVKPSLAGEYEQAFLAASASTAASSPTADPTADLRTAVQAYSDAYLTGDGQAAFDTLSSRCQVEIGKQPFVADVDSAGVNFGDAVPMKTFKAEVDGDAATVTYTYSVAAIDQADQPWLLEAGTWRYDDC